MTDIPDRGVEVGMQTSINDLSAQLTNLQDAQKKSRRQLVFFVVILVLEIFIFIMASYGRMKENFSTPKMEAALERVAPLVVDDVQRKVVELASEIAPVYQSEIIKQYETFGPKFEIKCNEAYNKLISEVCDEAQKTVERRLGEMAKRLDPDIKATFQGFSPHNSEDIIKPFHERIEKETHELALYSDKLYKQELANVEKAFLGFTDGSDPRVKELQAMSKTDLEWNLVHQMIRITDMYMDEMQQQSRKTGGK